MAAVPSPSDDAERVPGLDPVALARWHARTPTNSPWLHETVGARMAQRLAWIQVRPRAWIHWSPLLGGEQAHQAVVQHYPQAPVWLAGEGAAATWQRWQPAPTRWWQRWGRRADRDAAASPWGALAGVLAPGDFPSAPVGMVWANMALHTQVAPRARLRQWRDWLAVDGFLMVSGLGPDTLRELRAVHAAHGWPDPAPAFVDMHDWGDLLVETGFAEPVMDMERLTLTYPSAERLLADLRASGRNWRVDRFPGLRGRGWYARWLQAVERGLPRSAEGHLCLTIEVIYGHAWRPAPRALVRGMTAVPLEQLRAMLQRSAGAGRDPAGSRG